MTPTILSTSDAAEPADSSPEGGDGARPAFRPLPLLGHPHVQTLLGHLLPGPALTLPTRETVLRLPDGDGLLLHDNTPSGWRAGGRMVLLLHGLTGSADSPGVVRVAARLLAHGLRTVRLDLRGAGKGLPLARGFYHAGRSEDVRAVLEEMHRWSPDSPVTLLGVSLGGNLALKAAGEAADRPLPYLEAVAAMNPPVDVGRCAALMARPRNRVYDQYFVRLLMKDAWLRQRRFPDQPPPRFPRRMSTRLFDDLYTAPRNGFVDALDYYRRASSLPLVGRIRVPALILTARDDPFIAVAPFEEIEAPDNVQVCILPNGGHVGFVGWDGSGGLRWAESRIVNWVVRPTRRTAAPPDAAPPAGRASG